MNKTKRIFRFILCITLSVALLTMLGGAVLAEEDEFSVIADNDDDPIEEPSYDEEPVEDEPVARVQTFTPVAQDGELSLAVDMESGEFYVENTVSGKRWYSVPIDADADTVTKGLSRTNMRSQLLIGYLDKKEEATASYAQDANSYTECVLEGNVAVTKITGGVRVEFTFPVQEFVIPVEYTLKDGAFHAAIKTDEIKETGTYVLISVNLLPVFGAGNWEEKGYLFVPDGCGALVDFNNQTVMVNNYVSPVYGKDLTIVDKDKKSQTQSVLLPVFGTVVGTDGLMGVITNGDPVSEITLVNGNENCGYNAVSAILDYRSMQSQFNMFNKRDVRLISDPVFDGDYEVTYYTLTGDKANYIGMAERYRQYLIDTKGLAKTESKPALHVDALGAFEEEATFLGIIPYTKKVSLTTYAQCKEMLDDLSSAGIDSLSLRYIGWSNNGIKNVVMPKAANTMKALGSKKTFEELTAYLTEKNYTFYPDVDLLTYQKSANGVGLKKNSIRTIFDKVVLRPEYILSNYVTKLGSAKTALLSPEKIPTIAGRYLSSLQAKKLNGVSLAYFGEYCYANYYSKNMQTRAGYLNYLEQTLAAYRDAGVKMSFEGANAYVLPYASQITNVPTASSGYTVFDRDVPFYQAVLHGYVPYTTDALAQSADPEAQYLAAVETGSELLYYGIYEDSSRLFDSEYNRYYGSTWTLWKDKAVTQYTAYQPLLEKIHDKVITSHSNPQDEVFVTTYEGGYTVAVNYTAADVTVQGHTVPAKGFCEWEGNV